MEASNLEAASYIRGLRVLVIYLFFTSTLAIHACDQEKVFSDITQGKALVNHTYKTLQSVIDDDGCQFHCFLEDDCISYNFDEQQRICNLSYSDHIIHPEDLVDTPNAVYRALKNNGIFSSCKDIARLQSNRENKAYTIKIDNKPTRIYCHLTDDICEGGGWTLAMKIDGSKDTFKYTSSLWSNKQPYNLTAGQTGFDNYQTKMPSYWAMPFDKLCVGFKVNNVLKWTVIPYKASSLHDVISDGKYRKTNISKGEWMSLIDGSSLQSNCNEEGFNVRGRTRLGIVSNEQNDCNTCDSALGLGLQHPRRNHYSSGNFCYTRKCSNSAKNTAALGYLMIQ